MTPGPALALGTVQFGLPYGVAGRGAPVPPAEAKAILRRAWEFGIRRLDTAPGYGDIEERLARLAGDLPFSIVSKVGALPPGLVANAVREQVAHSVHRSRKRLGERLVGLLFHNAGDLLGPYGDEAWQALAGAIGPSAVARGASCYDVSALDALDARFGLDMTQLPGSALDQAVATRRATRPEVTLRSLFLQGLLLMPAREAAVKVPAARAALERWHCFCDSEGLSPLLAALAVAKGLPGIDYCVVGVDSIEQLEEIAAQWAEATPIHAPQLDTRDVEIIDPRRWRHG